MQNACVDAEQVPLPCAKLANFRSSCDRNRQDRPLLALCLAWIFARLLQNELLLRESGQGSPVATNRHSNTL
jgi:hypothetical protein